MGTFLVGRQEDVGVQFVKGFTLLGSHLRSPVYFGVELSWVLMLIRLGNSELRKIMINI